MKLYELQELINGVQYQAAVYEELISHLNKCLDEGIEIPVDIEEGVVPEDAIREVISQMKSQRDTLIQKLELAEDVEVTGVDAKDFALG